MDQMWEIIGIVAAVVMVILGLRLIFKKPQTTPPAEQHELIVEPQSQQPIVPRHLRVITEEKPILSQEIATEGNQQRTSQPDLTDSKPLDNVSSNMDASTVETRTESAAIEPLQSNIDASNAIPASDKNPTLDVNENIENDSIVAQQETVTSQSIIVDHQPQEIQEIEADKEQNAKNTVAVMALNSELNDETNILDAHLSEQSRHDEDSALATAEQILALYMYPNPGRALSGERTLKMLLKYGLRFGDMSCFHRYEHTDQTSPLMFSVLRISEDGTPTGFDLEALPTEEVKGLAFFLALPNPHAVQGFDMMVSLAGLMARDTDGMVFDEQSLELTPQLRDHWRHYVIEYKSE